MSNHFCSECNRLRLTADGKLRACLYGGKERDLKEALWNNLPDEEIRRIFVETVLSKPERHTMGDKPWGTRIARCTRLEDNRLKLTHINPEGRARMVDVSGKPDTEREARAEARVHMEPSTLELIENGGIKKVMSWQ